MYVDQTVLVVFVLRSSDVSVIDAVLFEMSLESLGVSFKTRIKYWIPSYNKDRYEYKNNSSAESRQK